jgi:hypothetical protein
MHNAHIYAILAWGGTFPENSATFSGNANAFSGKSVTAAGKSGTILKRINMQFGKGHYFCRVQVQVQPGVQPKRFVTY